MTLAGAPNRNLAFASALLEELVKSGVRAACVSPGSRSAPLALAAQHTRDLEVVPIVDERAAGFFALGLAKATRAPVLLICTSGSAPAHYFPAVLEAHYGGVPLIVLSADRPPEVREWGAGQTIQQHGLYGGHVRWFAEAAVPVADPAFARYARSLACRAYDAAAGTPAGPVHLNLPFREPLDPRAVETDRAAFSATDPGVEGRSERPFVRVGHGLSQPTPETLACLADRLRRSERGVVVCGPMDAPSDVAFSIGSLAARLGWPVVAEPASQLRCGPHVEDTTLLSSADLLLRSEAFVDTHRPDFVLRFGGTPTGRPVREWLARSSEAQHVLVDPGGRWQDADHRASELLRVDERLLCELLEKRLGAHTGSASAWRNRLDEVEGRARRAIAACLEDEALLAPQVVRGLARTLPEGTPLYVANSMPIRDVDAFWPASSTVQRFLCQRGTNGIDGLVASAAGAAIGGGGPVVLLCGDLAFLHDLGGLFLASQVGAPLVVLVIDNDGGEIFSQLPVARFASSEGFERLFRTPHRRDLTALARGLGAHATRITSLAHLASALKEGLTQPGPHVLVAPTPRDANLARRREIAQAVAEAVS